MHTPGVPKFSVLIVNYNAGAYLQQVLDSLKKQTVTDFEVICVDNDSTDGSVDDLDATGLPEWQLVRSEKNLGFAAGNNLAAKMARGEWICLLNPDAFAEPDWLEQIANGMARYPDCRTFACLQLNADNPDILDGVGDAYFFCGIPWRGGFGHPASATPDEGECFSPCGASAVFLRSQFLEFGGYDEELFCYCEDVDLGYRMQLAGEPCILLPKATILHKGGGTSGRYSYFTTYHGNRNRTWVYFKNTPLWLLILTLPAHLTILMAILLKDMFQKTGHRGVSEGIRAGLKYGWRKRQAALRAETAKQADMGQLFKAMSFNPIKMIQRAPDVHRSGQ